MVLGKARCRVRFLFFMKLAFCKIIRTNSVRDVLKVNRDCWSSMPEFDTLDTDVEKAFSCVILILNEILLQLVKTILQL